MFLLFKNLHLRQLVAITPAFLIATCGGIQLAYGIFNTNLSKSDWMYDRSIAAIAMVPIAFHIATIFGCFIGCLLYTQIEIFRIHLISSLLMLLGSVLFALAGDNFYFMLSSRICAGLSFGVTFNSALIYTSEISSPDLRARNLLILQLGVTLGMFLHSALFRFQILIGSISAFLAAIATPLAYFKMPPSHIFLIGKSMDSHDSFLYFQYNEIGAEYEALKRHFMAEMQRKFDFCSAHNSRSFGLSLVATLGYVSVFNFLHNFVRLVFVRGFLADLTEMTMMGCRLLGCLLAVFVVEGANKAWMYATSAVFVSAIFGGFGGTLLFAEMDFFVPATFFFAVEFLVGFGLAALGDVLRAELLGLREKPVLVSAGCLVQELLHIVSIVVAYGYGLSLGSNPLYWPFIFAPVTFVCGVFVVVFVKDTRGMTLRETTCLHD